MIMIVMALSQFVAGWLAVTVLSFLKPKLTINSLDDNKETANEIPK